MASSVVTIAFFLCLIPPGFARRTQAEAVSRKMEADLALRAEEQGLCDNIPPGLCSPQFVEICATQCTARQAAYDLEHPTEAAGESTAHKLGAARRANRCSNLPAGPCSPMNIAVCADACALKKDEAQPSTDAAHNAEAQGLCDNIPSGLCSPQFVALCATECAARQAAYDLEHPDKAEGQTRAQELGAAGRATRCSNLPAGPCSPINTAVCADECATVKHAGVDGWIDAPANANPRVHGGAKTALCKTIGTMEAGERCNVIQWLQCAEDCALREPEECKAILFCTEKWEENKCPDYCKLLAKRAEVKKQAWLLAKRAEEGMATKVDEVESLTHPTLTSPKRQGNSESDLDEAQADRPLDLRPDVKVKQE